MATQSTAPTARQASRTTPQPATTTRRSAPATTVASTAPRFKVTIETVTPQRANQWLAQSAPNRNLQQRHVNRLADDITNDRWQLNGESIKFSPEGDLVDGQHRLWAVIQAGKPIETAVARGVAEDAAETLDSGKPRSFADVLTMSGETMTRQIAAAAKLLFHYERGTMLTAGNQVSHRALLDVVQRHPELAEAVRTVANMRNLRGPKAALAFVYAIAREKAPDQADGWLEAIRTGVGLSRNDPALLLRNRLLGVAAHREQLRSTYVSALIIKSWNAWLEGRPLRYLAWRTAGDNAEEFPTILPENGQ